MRFSAGHIPWNKDKKLPSRSGKNNPMFGKPSTFRGRKHTSEAINKIRMAKLGKRRPDMVGNTFGRGKTPHNKGKKYTLEEKAKMNLDGLVLGRGWNKGMHCHWVAGEKNKLWRGGVTKLQKRIRKSLEYVQWRDYVFKRDDYTCQKCNVKSGVGANVILQADHVKPFSVIIRENNILTLEQAIACFELFDTSNGRTLCINCHKQTDTYGSKALNYSQGTLV